jgi:alcohol dehydrogenase/acrylyl-CoA reductase (NADPH)
MPFIIRGVKLWGIDSVMISKKRREFVWSQVNNFIDFKLLEKNIKIVNLEELLNVFPNMLKGEISGRVLVDLNK